MPDWLLWLSPVPVATLAAVVWTWWSGRSRPPAGPQETVREYERFRAALAVRPPDESDGPPV